MPDAADLARVSRPDPNTYWVVEGRFLAGEYPGARDPVEAQRKIGALLRAGITVFIDLTEAHELAPYARWLPAAGAYYRRFPIRDVSVPAEARQMQNILDDIDEALAAGSNVYLHWWGGNGRTGTVVACWLQNHGRSPEVALAELAGLWQSVAKRHRSPRTPETAEQVAWVKRWPELRAKLVPTPSPTTR